MIDISLSLLLEVLTLNIQIAKWVMKLLRGAYRNLKWTSLKPGVILGYLKENP